MARKYQTTDEFVLEGILYEGEFHSGDTIDHHYEKWIVEETIEGLSLELVSDVFEDVYLHTNHEINDLTEEEKKEIIERTYITIKNFVESVYEIWIETNHEKGSCMLISELIDTMNYGSSPLRKYFDRYDLEECYGFFQIFLHTIFHVLKVYHVYVLMDV